MLWWARKNSALQKQAREVRQQLNYNLTGNGSRWSNKQKLIHPRKKFRLGPFLAAALVFTIILGSRRCRPTDELTPRQMAQARIDIYIGCQVNNCTPEQLASQLSQLETYYKVKESKHE